MESAPIFIFRPFVQLVQSCSSHPGLTGLLAVISLIFRSPDDCSNHGCRIRGRYKQRLGASMVNVELLLAHAIAALSGVIARMMSCAPLPLRYDSLCTNATISTRPRWVMHYPHVTLR